MIYRFWRPKHSKLVIYYNFVFAIVVFISINDKCLLRRQHLTVEWSPHRLKHESDVKLFHDNNFNVAQLDTHSLFVQHHNELVREYFVLSHVVCITSIVSRIFLIADSLSNQGQHRLRWTNTLFARLRLATIHNIIYISMSLCDITAKIGNQQISAISTQLTRKYSVNFHIRKWNIISTVFLRGRAP